MGTETKSRIVLATARVAAAFARSDAGDEEVFYLVAALIDSAVVGDSDASAVGTRAVAALMEEFADRRSELAPLRTVAWLLERRLRPLQAALDRPDPAVARRPASSQ